MLVWGRVRGADESAVSRNGDTMAGSSYDKRGLGLGWVLAVLVIMYALTSGSVAIATSDKCGGYNNAKEWQYLPPRWVCR